MSDIVKITDHSLRAQNRLLYQYHESTKLKSLIDGLFGAQTQDLEDALYDFIYRLSIDDSEGIQLDKIGEIVGQPRYGFTDSYYRLFLKARIGKNVSEGDRERIISVWGLMSQSTAIHICPNYPCEVDIYYNNPLDGNLLEYAADLIQEVIAAGVALGQLVVFDADEAFSFESDKIYAKGFSDYNSPTLGGKLSYIQSITDVITDYILPVFSFYPSDQDEDTGGFSDALNPFLSSPGQFAYIVV